MAQVSLNTKSYRPICQSYKRRKYNDLLATLQKTCNEVSLSCFIQAFDIKRQRSFVFLLSYINKPYFVDCM